MNVGSPVRFVFAVPGARRSGLAFLFVAIGARSFWLPDIAVHVDAAES